MEAPEAVGDRVRRYRRLRDLTQEHLADSAEIDRRYLGRIETGDVLEPGVDTMRKLARALRVPLRALAEPLGWYAEETNDLDWERALLDLPGVDDATKQALLHLVRREVERSGGEKAS